MTIKFMLHMNHRYIKTIVDVVLELTFSWADLIKFSQQN
jgi:hypothetical protein